MQLLLIYCSQPDGALARGLGRPWVKWALAHKAPVGEASVSQPSQSHRLVVDAKMEGSVEEPRLFS